MRPIRPSIFISYSSKDVRFIERLERDLIAAQIAVWRDKPKLSAGDEFKRKIIEDGIRDTDLFLIYLTPNSLKSEWCQLELTEARRKYSGLSGSFIVPLIDSNQTRRKVDEELRKVEMTVCNKSDYSRGMAVVVFRAWEALQQNGRLIRAEGHIEAGINLQESPAYSRTALLARAKKQLILAGANLRGWLSDQDAIEKIVTLVKRRPEFQVAFLLGTYQANKVLNKDGEEHLQQSVRDLENIRKRLPTSAWKSQKRVTFRFHSALVTLSAVFIDPEDENGIAFFTPRWAIDYRANERLTGVVKRRDDPRLFETLYGSITHLRQPTNTGLDEMLRGLNRTSLKR